MVCKPNRRKMMYKPFIFPRVRCQHVHPSKFPVIQGLVLHPFSWICLSFFLPSSTMVNLHVTCLFWMKFYFNPPQWKQTSFLVSLRISLCVCGWQIAKRWGRCVSLQNFWCALWFWGSGMAGAGYLPNQWYLGLYPEMDHLILVLYHGGIAHNMCACIVMLWSWVCWSTILPQVSSMRHYTSLKVRKTSDIKEHQKRGWFFLA